MGLLALGFKGFLIVPTLPSLLSENLKEPVVETFGLTVSPIGEEDVAAIMRYPTVCPRVAPEGDRRYVVRYEAWWFPHASEWSRRPRSW